MNYDVWKVLIEIRNDLRCISAYVRELQSRKSNSIQVLAPHVDLAAGGV